MIMGVANCIRSTIHLFGRIGLVLFFLCTILLAQGNELDKLNKDFEDYKKSENKRWDSFREKENRAFADFLKSGWVSVKTQTALLSIPSPPLPDEFIQDNAEPKKLEEPREQLDTELPKANVHPIPFDAASTIDSNWSNTDSQFQRVEIDFFGSSIRIPYPEKILIQPKGISESDISQYWAEVSKVDYSIMTKEMEKISNQYKLGDWARFILLKQVSEKMFTTSNQQILFQFFLWNQLGFHARVAASGNELILLLPSKHKLYGLPFVALEGNRYYIVSGQNTGMMRTFSRDFSKSNKPIDLELKQSPVFNYKQSQRKLKPAKQNVASLMEYNQNLIDFMSILPQTDLDLIFKASVEETVTLKFKKDLSPFLVGKSELEQVSVLLNFVQQSFSYKTDQEQFGREKYFYVEEILHYPYSDCEDRAVLFAWLVRTLVGIPVIGLSYETHVATAVEFSEITKGDAVDWRGKKYIVCDPTYIGAGVGLSMPGMRNQAFRVIDIP
jgi:hypothetical protein